VTCLAWTAPYDHLSVTMRAEVAALLDNPFEYQPPRTHREMD
jgi:hypothetical protein